MKLVAKALLLAALLLPGLVRAEQEDMQGCESTIGAYVVALNNVTVTVKSSSVDVQSTSDVYVKSTGTASTSVAYEWSDDNTNWTPPFSHAHGSWCLKKKGRYIRFIASGYSSGSVTVKYAPGTVAGGSGGSPTTIAGTVGVSDISGTAGAALTTSAAANQAISANMAIVAASQIVVSPNQVSMGARLLDAGNNAFGTIANPVITSKVTWPTSLNVSLTSRTVSSPISLNISAVAGVVAPSYAYRISVSGTTSVGILWAETSSATWPCNACFGSLVPNNLAALVDNRYAGTHVHLSPVSATDISGTAALGVDTEVQR